MASAAIVRRRNKKNGTVRFPHTHHIIMATQVTPTRTYRVAVLGATGTVGQRFVQLLEHHPWFTVAVVAASERSAGRPYGQVVRWKLAGAVPAAAAALVVQA